jgi:beta-aspartyl-peptidase (threonine type)
MKAAIIVHGGAWDIPSAEHRDHQNGCRRAVLEGYTTLAGGGTALDAVEAAVTVLEDAPAFDAGTGSHLNRAGVVQLDAGIMDGATLQIGAVAAVEKFKNPIQIARRLLTSDHSMFVGPGADAWAKRQGFLPIDPATLIVLREKLRFEQHQQHGPPDAKSSFQQSDGTVGAVAIDHVGNLAAATSTGGTLYKPAGRVGDSPLPGCGYFADNQSAAVSATGYGESIIKVQLSRTAADFAKTGPQPDPLATYAGVDHQAAQAAIDTLTHRVNGWGGLIMIDRLGRVGFAYNTPNLARAYLIEGMSEPVVGI